MAHIPVYVKPDKDMLLLRLDYMGFYFPRIHFLKFGFIKSLLSTHLPSETRDLDYEVSPEKRVDCVDLTRDFFRIRVRGAGPLSRNAPLPLLSFGRK